MKRKRSGNWATGSAASVSGNALDSEPVQTPAPDETDAAKSVRSWNLTATPVTIDWFLAAAGVCAVCGVIVAALAVTALVKGKRRNGV